MTKNPDPVHAALISDRRLIHNGFLIEHRKANNQSEDAQTVANSWQNPLFPSLGWRNWLRYWIGFPMKLTLMMASNGADQRRSKSICQKKPQGKTRKYC